jgi:hypothetical protein
MAALAPMRVVGPAPKPPAYGLTTTPGTIVDQADPHWMAGVLVDSYPADLPRQHNPCSDGTSRVKATGEDPPSPEFSSFTVYLPVTCSGLGVGNEAGAQLLRNRALEAFRARETFGVERELAFGSVDIDRPHLTQIEVADQLNSGGAVGPREGISLLENAIGETAQEGVIHVDPATFDAGQAWGLFVANAGVMRTVRGNLVIIGNGYIGARPDAGPALGADHGWAFATGPVAVSRDEPQVQRTAEVFNHETNEITFRVERNYVAYWDTALLKGVLIDRSVTP